MTDQRDEPPKKASKWREFFRVLAVAIPYMIPLFWLWSKTGFPDALGVHIAAHGKAGLLEHWWYSYLLLERANLWDLVLFAYMWLPFVVFIGWLVWAATADIRSSRDN